MHPTLARFARIVLATTVLGCTANAFAGSELMGVEPKYRARIAKEKIRAAAQERQNEAQEKKALDQSGCGSQSIGNVDTGGRAATAPRELFVFAPNAINIVGRGSC